MRFLTTCTALATDDGEGRSNGLILCYHDNGKEADDVKVEVLIDPTYPEPSLIIRTAEMTQEVAELVRLISSRNPQPILGVRDEKLVPILPEDIIRIYGADGKVIAATAAGEYTLRLRLYELEERLDKRQFVRISNGEIINLKKVLAFDLSFTGTICVTLQHGMVSYVSRRYVKVIRQTLGL